jgi:AcrR family transcriptional regulator
MTIDPLTPERRRRQTRDYLLQAAAQVFAERGYHGASLDEVAAVAGFSKGAVYSNFKNKEDLFLALLESHYEREMAAVRATLEATDGPPEAYLSDFVTLLRDQFQGTEDNWALLTEEFRLYAMRNPAAREKLAAFDTLDIDSIAEIIEGERARHGIDLGDPTQHVARIVIALMRGISTMRNLDPDAVDEPFLETVMAFLIRAMT